MHYIQALIKTLKSSLFQRFFASTSSLKYCSEEQKERGALIGGGAINGKNTVCIFIFSFKCEDFKHIIPFVKKKIVRNEEDKVPQKFWKKLLSFELKKHMHSVKKRRQNAKGGQIQNITS